jgi:hypothetical protein
MVLYRPFLHAVSARMTAGKKPDDRSYALGAAGINVARNIVRIGIEMRKQVSLVGPYWFTLFTEFFAIITLVFYILENENKPGTADIMADAAAGRKMVSDLARRSVAADRVSKALEVCRCRELGAPVHVLTCLQVLFDQLPDSMKTGASNMPSKKRSAASSKEAVSAALSPPALHLQTPRTGVNLSGTPNSREISEKGSTGSLHPGVFDMDSSFGIDDFSPSMQGMSPLDLANTPTDAVPVSQGEQGQHVSDGSGNGIIPIHQLDAVMFPSRDPLAYPNHAGMEMGAGSQHQSQYYMPNMFDGIEGQLMGPLPPYLMQSQGQPGFSFPPQVYPEPMLAMSAMPMPRNAQHQAHPHHQASQRRRTFSQFGGQQWSGMFPQYQ